MQLRRRRFLATAAGLAAVTGCVGDSGSGDPTDEPTDDATPDPTPEPTPTLTVPKGDDSTATPTDTAPAGGTDDPDPTHTGSPPPEPEPPTSIDADWPMPAHDPGLSNAAADAPGPTDPVGELWTVTADETLSGPVLADGTLYVGGEDGAVRAFDARTGDEQWSQSVGSLAGQPWAHDGRLYVPTDAAVVALDPADGAELWRTETPDRAGPVAGRGELGAATMVVADHGLYWVAGRESPEVVALDPADGSEDWRTAIADPWRAPIFAGPDAVFVSSGPYDSRFWQLDPATGDQRNEDPRRGADFPAESCYADGTVYAVEAFFGGIRANSVSDRGRSWYEGVPPGGGGPGGGALAAGTDRVYYTTTLDDAPEVHARSVADGTSDWTADLDGTVAGRPVVAGEAVVVPVDSGVTALDPVDGAELWAIRLDAAVDGALVADDLLFATQGDVVRAYRAP